MTEKHDIMVMCDYGNNQFILQNDMSYIVMDKLEVKGLANRVGVKRGEKEKIGEVHYNPNNNNIELITLEASIKLTRKELDSDTIYTKAI